MLDNIDRYNVIEINNEENNKYERGKWLNYLDVMDHLEEKKSNIKYYLNCIEKCIYEPDKIIIYKERIEKYLNEI